MFFKRKPNIEADISEAVTAYKIKLETYVKELEDADTLRVLEFADSLKKVRDTAVADYIKRGLS
jgi:hypothetical protein